MALFNCLECGKEISSKAKFCISCGAPVSDESKGTEDVLTPEIQKTEMEITFRDKVEVEKGIAQEKSFWSYDAAKVMLGLVIVSICLSIFALIPKNNSSGVEQRLTEAETTNIYQDTQIAALSLGARMSGGVVTDKAVVDKASVLTRDGTNFMVFIDITPQPIYRAKFLGQGNFDLADRELKSMLQEIADASIEFIKSGSLDKSIIVSTIFITANNYDVGRFENGVITLAGE